MNRELLKLAIPNVLTNLTVPLLSLVDLGLMGRMPNSNYIVAIGLAVVVFNVIYWAFGFLRMGTTGLVSQAYGRDNTAACYEYLRKGLVIAVLAGIFLILSQSWIIKIAAFIFEQDPSVLGLIDDYFRIRIYAAPATIGVYVLTGWFLGMQDSKSAFWLALIINVSNILISLLFVQLYNLEIAGVAIGTLCAQYVGLGLGFLILKKKYQKDFLEILNKKETDSTWFGFLSINSDLFVRTMLLILVLSFFKTKAANIDPLIGAANILLLEFITISAYGIDGFAFAAESICGKYFGKGQSGLFKNAVMTSFKWGIGVAFLFSVVFYYLGEEVLYLLTDKSEIIQVAMEYLPWLIIAPLINSFAFIWDGIYIGATASKAMRNLMIISSLIFFLPTFYFARPLFENHGLWLALSVFMLSRGILQTIYYNKTIASRLPTG
tara:strand:+ start:7732 stop:9036 length:1305 start_codon:yes stop_codon:yes gene_type:complete